MRSVAMPPIPTGEFFDAYDGVEGRWELHDGVPVETAGGSLRHAQLGTAITIALGVKLRGSGCQPFNSDAGLYIDLYNVRYPDVTVYCDRRDLDSDLRQVRAGRFPTAVFEVLSPSASHLDRGRKLGEYKRIPTMRIVALVDPERQTVSVAEWIGDGTWRDREIAAGDTMPLTALGIHLTYEETFGTE